MLDPLYTTQEQHGYLSEEALRRVAERLGMSLKDVYSTASFYSSYWMKPAGQYIIQVCVGQPGLHPAGFELPGVGDHPAGQASGATEAVPRVGRLHPHR